METKSQKSSILVIDDDQRNLKIIKFAADEEDYKVHLCEGAKEGLKLLEKEWANINVILLDWMMPEMSGIEVLREIKKNPDWKNIPVIFQTAKTKRENILEGINEGAYYYLTKPFDMKVLLAVIKAAEKDYSRYKSLTKPEPKNQKAKPFLEEGTFRFKTIEEGKQIINWLSEYWPKRQESGQGFFELITNAVEHGNLEISYEEKSQLMADDKYEEEITKRYNDEKFQNRRVILHFKLKKTIVEITITDEGAGFTYEDFLDFSPERVYDLNGRGIAMARKMYLDRLTYTEPGNSVKGIIDLEESS